MSFIRLGERFVDAQRNVAYEGLLGGRPPFGRSVGVVTDTARTLDEIEHEIIREQSNTPRFRPVLVRAPGSRTRSRFEAHTGLPPKAQVDD